MTATLRPGTQSERLLRWLRANPGASSLEMTLALNIVNTTGRISDLRAAGYVIDCRKRPDGYDGYFVREAVPVTRGEAQALPW